MLIALFVCATLSPLDRAERALAASDFERAAQLSETLIANGALDKDSSARAQRIAALAQFYLGDKTVSEAHLREFFKLQPNAEVDEKRSPPDWVAFFQSVKARTQPRPKAVEPPPPPPEEKPPPIEAHKSEGGFSGKSLVPFGIGQLLLGDKVAGGAFLGIDLALFGADLALYFVRVSNRSPDDSYADAKTANALQIGQDVAAFGLIAVTIIGVVDAIVWSPSRVARSHVSLQMAPVSHGAELGALVSF